MKLLEDNSKHMNISIVLEYNIFIVAFI